MRSVILAVRGVSGLPIVCTLQQVSYVCHLLREKEKWNESRKDYEKRYISSKRGIGAADRLHAATGFIRLPLLNRLKNFDLIL